MTAPARRKKTIKDLRKRRHVRTAHFDLAVGDADVTALALSLEKNLLTFMTIDVMVDGKPEGPEREAAEPMRTLAKARLDEAQAAFDVASERVTFREVPHHVFQKLRLDPANKEALIPALCAAEWTDQAGVKHAASDYPGTVEDWQELIAELPPGDFNSLSTAILTVTNLDTPSLGKGR